MTGVIEEKGFLEMMGDRRRALFKILKKA